MKPQSYVVWHQVINIIWIINSVIIATSEILPGIMSKSDMELNVDTYSVNDCLYPRKIMLKKFTHQIYNKKTHWNILVLKNIL